MTDYWVNGFDGLAFFKVNCAVDPGMIKVLEDDIVPILEERVPHQPTEAELNIIRDGLGEHHQDEARGFVRNLYKNEANYPGTELMMIYKLVSD